MSDAEIQTEDYGWTKENLKKLLAAMKVNIPKCSRKCSYHRGLKTLDWNKVAFPPFSSEACQEKWGEILQKMRKLRSLTELIVDAEDVLSNPAKNRKMYPEFLKGPRRKQKTLRVKSPKERKKKVSADTLDGEQSTEGAECVPPKPPVNGYSLFCKEQTAFMEGVSKKEYVSVWARRWRDLTEEQRKDYSTRCMALKRKYTNELNEYLKTLNKEEQRQILTENGIKRPKKHEGEQSTEGAECLPPKPPVNGYSLFFKEQVASMVGVSPKDYMSVLARHWRDLTDRQRNEYIRRCTVMKRKYATELNEYLKTFDEEEQQRILNENGIRKPKQPKEIIREVTRAMRLPGEPKMPPRSGNAIYCKKLMVLLKKEFPNTRERFTKVNQKWQELPTKEKEQYKMEVHQSFKKYSMELQKWFKTLTAAEQENYQTHNRNKCQYLNTNKINIYVAEERCLDRPSDSEDEDLNDSSSDEEQFILDLDEDEEEDEEEGDIAFEMY